MPTVAESWFRSIWKTPRKGGENSEKVVIGVLAFEVASLMSKIVNLWQSLSDKQVSRLRDEITNSVGIKKLVSDDENFIVRLISLEMLENLAHVAESVARLGKRCSNSSLKGFGDAFDEFIILGVDPYKWEFTTKKMEKKIKRMEKFISTNASLYQEMELLNDLEQTLKRMKAYGESDGANVVDYQKKLAWKKVEVKNIKDNSLWNRTYDYAVLLLARSLFTIFSRINNVFGIQEVIDARRSKISGIRSSGYSHDSHSVSELLQPSGPHASENNVARFASGPLGALAVKAGRNVRSNKNSIFSSGPLGDSSINAGQVSGKQRRAGFFSGQLVRSLRKPVPDNGTNKNSIIWKLNGQSTTINGKETHARHGRLTQVGPFKGCVTADTSSVVDCYSNRNDVLSRIQNPDDANSNLPAGHVAHCARPVFSSICKLKPPSESLGAASLALHYANVIIVIEKLAASPYMVGLDARDDLYNMLPRRVRDGLRAKLKPYKKAMTTDTTLADEWTEAITRILEWLAPLAHSMLRWQSERSYEQHSFVSRTNVLLVQTLYFANQERIEAAITELLVGLNYVWRHARDPNAKNLVECGKSRVQNKYAHLNG